MRLRDSLHNHEDSYAWAEGWLQRFNDEQAGQKWIFIEGTFRRKDAIISLNEKGASLQWNEILVLIVCIIFNVLELCKSQQWKTQRPPREWRWFDEDEQYLRDTQRRNFRRKTQHHTRSVWPKRKRLHGDTTASWRQLWILRGKFLCGADPSPVFAMHFVRRECYDHSMSLALQSAHSEGAFAAVLQCSSLTQRMHRAKQQQIPFLCSFYRCRALITARPKINAVDKPQLDRAPKLFEVGPTPWPAGRKTQRIRFRVLATWMPKVNRTWSVSQLGPFDPLSYAWKWRGTFSNCLQLVSNGYM